MIGCHFHHARAQAPLADAPYDRWVTPDGDAKAGFYRLADSILVRFYGEADFEISLRTDETLCWPAFDADPAIADNLFRNAITPLLSNYAGGLNLHGSAVASDRGAVAFLGHSRSGKTTLAAAFAGDQMRLVTEDVVDLKSRDGRYQAEPKEGGLRLFADSAAYLTGDPIPVESDNDTKQAVKLPASYQRSTSPEPLAAVFLLRDSNPAAVTITPLPTHLALTQLLQHSFILDVEDKSRLRKHFARLADLASTIACYELDYPRRYSALPDVMSAVKSCLKEHSHHAAQ